MFSMRSTSILALASLLLTLPAIASAASCPNLVRSLSFGSRGQDVVELQNFLIVQGNLAAGNNTGYFGRLTEKAVQQFQCTKMKICSGSPESNGYGAVGPRTRASIQAACATTTSTPAPYPYIPAAWTGVQESSVVRLYGTEAGSCSFSFTCSTCGQSQYPMGLLNGTSVRAYRSEAVNQGATCESEIRTCQNGALSGSYAYASCKTVAAYVPPACIFPGPEKGRGMVLGESLRAYRSGTVPMGEQCVAEMRTCTSSGLSGAFQFVSCTEQTTCDAASPSVCGVRSQSSVQCLRWKLCALQNGQGNCGADACAADPKEYRTFTNACLAKDAGFEIAQSGACN